MSSLPIVSHVIAIDGPAGAGKSTLGELLAARLGYLYFDTGVMYRALTLAALQQQVPFGDAEAMAALASRIHIMVEQPHVNDGRQYTVLLDGQDVTHALRDPQVEQAVSVAAKHPAVRTTMREQQRAIALKGRVVMVGRDIGTAVMPDAELKVFLNASLEERARRRTEELRAKGRDTTEDSIREAVARRDALDRHVMLCAPDALIIDGDRMTPDDEVALVVETLAHQRART